MKRLDKKKRKKKRGKGGGVEEDRPVSGSLLDQLVRHKRPSFPSFSRARLSPSLLSDLRARGHTGACISLRRCVWPATIRVWNSNSAAQLSESRSSGCVGWNDRGRDAWKRFILPVCPLVGGLYRIERYRIGWLKGEIYDEGGCKTNWTVTVRNQNFPRIRICPLLERRMRRSGIRNRNLARFKMANAGCKLHSRSP